MRADASPLTPAGSHLTLTEERQALHEGSARILSPDEALEKIGASNRRLIVAMCSAAFIWVLGAMPLMASSFVADTKNSSLVTLVEEFRLTEAASFWANLPTSAYMAGNIAGGVALTKASDHFGRRPLLLLSLALFGASGVLASFAPTLLVYCILRIFQGAFYTGSTIIGWVAGYEMSPAKMRPYTTLIFGIAWVLLPKWYRRVQLIGYAAVAPLAYFSATWRDLMLYVAVPTLFYVAWAYLLVAGQHSLIRSFLPETLHFLARRGTSAQIDRWLLAICGDTKLKLSARNIRRDVDDETPVNGLAAIWKHKKFFLYFTAMVYLWMCDTFTYFGLSLHSTSLSGNKWINYLLMGAVELPAYIFTPMLIDHFGRKKIVAGSHFVAGLAFGVLVFKPQSASFVLTNWLVAKLAITLSFMAIFVYASEVFPTDIRNSLVGLCTVIAKIGGIASPQLANMALIHETLPEITLTAICLLGGLLTLLLPETAHVPLPASVEEALKTAE